MVVMVNYISGNVFKDFDVGKKVQRVLVLNLVEISKDFLIYISIKITETRFDLEPVFYFWIKVLFTVCMPHVYANTLNYALVFFPVMSKAVCVFFVHML